MVREVCLVCSETVALLLFAFAEDFVISNKRKRKKSRINYLISYISTVNLIRKKFLARFMSLGIKINI